MAGRQVTLDSAHLPPLIAVVSPKGGCGKTALASNLALAFAMRTPSVLVDLNVYSGDLEWALGVQPAYRLHDVARRLREDTSSELEGMFTSRGANLSMLCSPDSHIAADGLVATDVSTIARRLVDLQRPVVLDTSPGMSDFTLDAIEAASRIVLVTTTDVASVQAARKLLDTMSVLRLDTGRVTLAVNRSTSSTGLSVSDVEQRLGFAATLKIPESKHVAEGLNAGRPIVETHPESQIAGDITSFADSLLGVTIGKRFSFWWKRGI
jgi:pilus assembly protein CpaE